MRSARWRARYEAHHVRGGRYGYVYGGEWRPDLFREWVGSGAGVLDLGCRDGTLTAAYRGGNRLVGADIDLTALGEAGRGLGIPTVCADLNDPLPFASKAFDVVVAGEVLEHLIHPASFLAEVARVLAPDGRFMGSTPNAFRLRNRWRFLWGREYDTDETHLHRFSPGRLRRLLEASFAGVEIQALGGHFLGGGRRGIRVGPGAPRWARKLFALDLAWRCRGPRPPA